MVGSASLVILTEDEEGGQTPLAITHVKILEPILSPETAAEGFVVLLRLAAPAVTTHEPVPAKGVFAFKLAADAHSV